MNGHKQTAAAIIRACLCSSAVLLGGCAKPNAANIELRKRNQALEAEIASLKLQHNADAATIRSLQDQRGTAPTLPQDRLEQLFTVHGIKLGRLTGGDDADPEKPGDEVLKVYVVPIDETGDELKAAGSFVVEAFDLARQANNRIGRWEFDVAQARQSWFGQALLYGYVLTCPWPTLPQHPELTLRVTFRDELTGREFTQQKVITVVIR